VLGLIERVGMMRLMDVAVFETELVSIEGVKKDEL